MATPFDEKSVDLCQELGIEIIKIASSDVTDWVLLEKIAKTRKPVIVSTGGASVRDMDAMVTFFSNRNIPLAINHCVSLYPTEDHELELNQIDFLKHRYPTVTIGLSTHEYQNWTYSIVDRLRQGRAHLRAAHRHRHAGSSDLAVLLDAGADPPLVRGVSQGEGDVWRERGGAAATEHKEIEYLDALVRGVYAVRDLPAGHVLTDDDYYLAVPLQKGQLSCRELITTDVLVKPVKAHEPITIDVLDNPYSRVPELRQTIAERGL